jgi:hypothetical protein
MPSFDIRYSLFDIRHSLFDKPCKAKVSFSIKLVAFQASGAAHMKLQFLFRSGRPFFSGQRLG